MSWEPQVGETWRSTSMERCFLLVQFTGAGTNYFHFVGLDLERGDTYEVNILNNPTTLWQRLA